ncbi:MAG TPA: hypothetical protein VFP84_17810 [Kofleriaceae bacterium]|nr:hypothetical protein [Kofleriaceae bacterium]
MRAIIAFALLAGCASTSAGSGAASSGSRPGVLPLLSELPSDPTKRDAVLDQSQAVAGPEQRKGMTVKERKTETAAATAAAILGGMFSKTQNVTLGSATTFDESALAPLPVAPPAPVPSDPATPAPANDPAIDPATDLTPWIKLR